MTITNSQYAFLQVDFQNPNLTQVVKNAPVEVNLKSETELNLIPFNLYLNFNAFMRWLLMIPVDIYFATAWMIAHY